MKSPQFRGEAAPGQPAWAECQTWLGVGQWDLLGLGVTRLDSQVTQLVEPLRTGKTEDGLGSWWAAPTVPHGIRRELAGRQAGREMLRI